nr:MAG TPA_asm: hypothetical protein [Caudoviricetes sp.]
MPTCWPISTSSSPMARSVRPSMTRDGSRSRK